MTTLVLCIIVIGPLVVLFYWRPVWLLLKRRSFKKFLIAYHKGMMRPAPTVDEIVNSMFGERENYQGDDPERQAMAFHYRLLRALRNDRKPNQKEVKCLFKLGKLGAVNAFWVTLYPDAAYELGGIGDDIILFRKNLSIAGLKNFHSDVETILINALERKRLLPTDVAFLRYVGRLYKSEEWQKWKGQYYGGPGLPYPDERYHVREMVRGILLALYFNESFDLIVVTKSPENRKEDEPFDEVVWELPGARQPELYQ